MTVLNGVVIALLTGLAGSGAVLGFLGAIGPSWFAGDSWFWRLFGLVAYFLFSGLTTVLAYACGEGLARDRAVTEPPR